MQRDQLWELPLYLERDIRGAFSWCCLKGHQSFRGRMCGVTEELPLVVFEEEAGNFRGEKALVSFQNWFPKRSQDSDSLFLPLCPFSRLQFCWSCEVPGVSAHTTLHDSFKCFSPKVFHTFPWFDCHFGASKRAEDSIQSGLRLFYWDGQQVSR